MLLASRRAVPAAVLVVCALAAAAPARAQDSSLTPLSDQPPVQLGGKHAAPAPAASEPQLAHTGTDPLLVALYGIGMLSTGLGLRRLAD